MSDDFEAEMARLKAQFVDRLREDAADLRALAAGEDADRDARIGEIAHRVAGMAALFGFDDLTTLGKLADRAAKTGENRAAIDDFIAAVGAAVA